MSMSVVSISTSIPVTLCIISISTYACLTPVLTFKMQSIRILLVIPFGSYLLNIKRCTYTTLDLSILNINYLLPIMIVHD